MINRMSKYLLILSFSILALSAQDITVESDSLNQADSLVIMPEMKKQMTDSWFAQDKVLHFSAGFAIPGLTYHFYVCRLESDEDRGKVYAVSLTALLALGKELYDKKTKGRFSWKDLAWSGAGLAVGYLVFIH
jgi:uncharacterized protein YfiM (DUF2279 family)